MLLKDKKIAIIGGGPGGLTLAKLLQLQFVNVIVYERDTDKNARVQGAPLDLHEHSGLAALRSAGLLDEFKRNFMPGADKTTITNAHAEIVFSDHENKVEENFGHEHFRPEIDRGVLRKILLDSLQPETIVWNSHFLSMEQQGSGWLLHFKNKESEYADIVIGADGANSKIRPYVTEIKPLYSGIVMLEGNIYKASENAPQMSALLKGGKIMAFGKDKNILMGQKANGEIGFYASFRAEENWPEKSKLNFSDREEILNWFKTHYAEWSEIWQELFEQTNLPFIPRPINYMPLNQTWDTVPNLTILGDSAHLMPPFAGEGVNMAMLDALELSDALLSKNHQSIPEAISFYEINMRKRAAQIAQESLENGEKMHDENALNIMTDFFSGAAEKR